MTGGAPASTPCCRRRLANLEAILAKTQSRFTRDMELVERYLHGLFPGVGRAVHRGAGSRRHARPGREKGRVRSTAWINEWYLEDLSPRMCGRCSTTSGTAGATLPALRCTATARTLADHNRLVIDPPAAAVVRKIFALYLAGYGTAKIAALLNKETIPPPAAYRAPAAWPPRAVPRAWSKATVRRILATRTYAGDMEQGRVRKLNYKPRRRYACRRRLDRRAGNTGGHHRPRRFPTLCSECSPRAARACACGQTHLLAGLVHCGICGGKMELTGTAARRYFRCRTAQRSRAACPGQRYLPMADAEALMQKLLCGDTALLTRAEVCAAVNKLVVDPPQNGMRPIQVYARPGVVGQGTPAHVG